LLSRRFKLVLNIKISGDFLFCSIVREFWAIIHCVVLIKWCSKFLGVFEKECNDKLLLEIVVRQR
jgi:hypothetical protein